MLNFRKLVRDKALNLYGAKIPTAVFLGDSVTQGCFELYRTGPASLETYFDPAHSYMMLTEEKIHAVYPNVPLAFINAGISGDSAAGGVSRLDRDVLCYHPDLVTVCYGLNDVCGGVAKVEEYANNLRTIFHRVKESGAEVLFILPNPIPKTVHPLVTYGDEFLKNAITGICAVGASGDMDVYMEAACKVCEECAVPYTDVYHKFKALEENGADMGMLLANHVNHPARPMLSFFAEGIFNAIFF